MENGHTDSGGLLANCGEGGGFSFVFGFVNCSGMNQDIKHIFNAGNQIYYGKSKMLNKEPQAKARIERNKKQKSR
ncbi:hypothetical protein NC651_003554 [Populus alba x Populus x berolinensis]|nr:hypothetical protein NC651_003554 [Populus alba x Populus x berolinensis]